VRVRHSINEDVAGNSSRTPPEQCAGQLSTNFGILTLQ
jgi:hypothetical protein